MGIPDARRADRHAPARRPPTYFHGTSRGLDPHAEFSSRQRDIRDVRDAVEAQLGRPVSDDEQRRIWLDTRTDKSAR